MYTTDIGNQQHRSMLEHQWIGVGKSPISNLWKIVSSVIQNDHLHCRLPRLSALWVVVRGGWPTPAPQTETTTHAAVAVGDVGGHPAGRRQGLQRTLRRPIVRCDRCDTKLKLMLFPCGGRHGGTLSPTGRIFQVFQAANDRRWDNYRRSASFVQWRASCWPVCSCKCCCECGLCRPAMHGWDVHSYTISHSHSLGASAPLKR